ncbi:hypothetical protein MTO96_005406 [Rhipicephalus appendiculatus]
MTSAGALGSCGSPHSWNALKKALFEEMAALFPKPFLNHVTRILRSAKWTTLMPDWAHTALLRAKYIDYFYAKAGRVPVHQQFALLIKRKNANQYKRYLTGIFFDAPWTGGLLRTSATVGEDRVDVPPGAFDFFRADADEPSLVPLQMARLGPRVATNVYRFVFTKALDFLYHTGHQKSYVLLDDARSCVWNQFSTNFASQEDGASNMSLRSEHAGWPLLAHVLAAAPSFRAFLSALDGDLYLRGLERYSSERLYFVYYALSYCESNDPRFLDRLLEDGDEPPAWHAVNGALRNFRAFADAFNCSVGSFMNPEEKCTWTF